MKAFLLAFFLVSGVTYSTAPSPLVLQTQRLSFTPKEYFIASVTDQRTDRRAVAHLITAPTHAAEAVNLSGGAATAINQFIQQGVRQNSSLRPVTIRLLECRITETAPAANRIEGQLALTLAFDVTRDGETFELVTYRGSAHYQRPMGQLEVVEPTLRQALVNGLTFFNNWINRNASQHEKLATRLQVNITDYLQNTDNDTVFYSPTRPLIWADFLATKSRPSRYSAQVFTSFAYEGRSDVKNGVIMVNLLFKVYTLKSSSWVTEPAHNAYGLNHEQRHFDITKLVVEQFKRKIRSDSLSLNDYNSEIQYQYIESFREMNHRQEAYDGETNHGINQVDQEQWNQRLDAELRGFKLK